MSEKITIYHNNKCSKSREALCVLKEEGSNFEIVEYLKDIQSSKELKVLLIKLGISAHDLMRKGEQEYKDHVQGKTLSESEMIELMVKFPKLIEHEINALSAKFETGETGKYTEHGQIQNVIKVIILHQEWSYAMKYGTMKRLHDAGIIPYSYITRRLIDTASFRNDPKGPTFAIKRSLQSLLDSGKLRELSKEQLKQFM